MLSQTFGTEYRTCISVKVGDFSKNIPVCVHGSVSFTFNFIIVKGTSSFRAPHQLETKKSVLSGGILVCIVVKLHS